MARRNPSKYEPLGAYLAAQPTEVDVVALTFPAIEALIGSPLPRSAWVASFWANARRTRRVPMQVRAWQDAGWRTAGLRRGLRPWTVTFVRADMTPSSPPHAGAPGVDYTAARFAVRS